MATFKRWDVNVYLNLAGERQLVTAWEIAAASAGTAAQRAFRSAVRAAQKARAKGRSKLVRVVFDCAPARDGDKAL